MSLYYASHRVCSNSWDAIRGVMRIRMYTLREQQGDSSA